MDEETLTQKLAPESVMEITLSTHSPCLPLKWLFPPPWLEEGSVTVTLRKEVSESVLIAECYTSALGWGAKS